MSLIYKNTTARKRAAQAAYSFPLYAMPYNAELGPGMFAFRIVSMAERADVVYRRTETGSIESHEAARIAVIALASLNFKLIKDIDVEPPPAPLTVDRVAELYVPLGTCTEVSANDGWLFAAYFGRAEMLNLWRTAIEIGDSLGFVLMETTLPETVWGPMQTVEPRYAPNRRVFQFVPVIFPRAQQEQYRDYVAAQGGRLYLLGYALRDAAETKYAHRRDPMTSPAAWWASVTERVERSHTTACFAHEVFYENVELTLV